VSIFILVELSKIQYSDVDGWHQKGITAHK